MATPDITTIPLTRDRYTIVDKCDEDLSIFKWQARPGRRGCFYAARTKYPGKSYEGLHRAIMSRVLERPLVAYEIVDHIDGNPLNNLRSNLRLVSPRENVLNSSRRNDNTSGYKGVTFRKDCGLWRARIVRNGKRVTVGYAETAEAAFELYKTAAKIEYGEYIRWE